MESEPIHEALPHRPGFATTHWSVVLAAADSTADTAEVALEQLCRQYWFPLYAFLRRRGIGAQDAEDLTQSFLADFLRGKKIGRADPTRGRFRSFLVHSLELFLHNEWRRNTAAKRGGGIPNLPLDIRDAEHRYARDARADESPASVYDRQWALAILDQVAGALEADWARQRQPELFHALMSHLWADPDSIPYAELCARFDITAVNLRVLYHRFRRRYRDLLRAVVASTLSDPTEVDQELQLLMEAVRR